MPKKKSKNVFMKEATDVMKVGATSVVGHGVLGGLSGMPGMPAAAAGTANIAGAGLRLAAVGQVAKSGLTIAKSMTGDKDKSKKTKSKKSSGNIVDNILGK